MKVRDVAVILLALLGVAVLVAPAPAVLDSNRVIVESSRATPVILASPFSRWSELGTITSQQAYPAVGDRDYTTVAALAAAKTVVWDLRDLNYARKVALSFQTSANADSTTVELLGFADEYSYDVNDTKVADDAVYLGKLVLTGGQQVGKHSNVYVDTVTATDGVAAFSVTDSGNDRRTVVEFACKYKVIVFVATTLQASSTLYVEGRLSP